ncbi:hypothetical protein HYN48_12145 [Flavobacterium magnum]|uniref:Uncharacterized protein n=1 Tax=Flavobacterium magnum TaxID=2162713 RepID=A0A2S0RHS5_9FLAO|nr:STM3941 family protein [Flavobacterium magnum]AWA30768.1 hypothetical protein HYN48_12145 [Flavobacterium magnum]
MYQLTFYKSRWVGIRLLGVSGMFVSIGLWMVWHKPYGEITYFFGLAAAGFFGIAMGAALFIIFDRRPQLVITPRGVWDRTSKKQEVRWDQVLETRLININGQRFIAVKTTDDFVFRVKRWRWATMLSSAFGAERFNLALGHLAGDPDKIAALVREMHSADESMRSQLIQRFKTAAEANSSGWTGMREYLYYFLFLVLLIAISLNIREAFLYIMVATAIPTVISRFYQRWSAQGSTPKLVRYCDNIAYLGFIHLVAYFWIIQLNK